MALDVEWLIFEIRSRPIIWDNRINDYTDKIKKDAAWREIARSMNELFDVLDTTEQGHIVGDLQEKWSNVRRGFCKELRFIKGKNGDSTQKKKKYIFFDQLNFLEGVIHQRKRSSKDASVDEVNMTEVAEYSEIAASPSPECGVIEATPSARSGGIAATASPQSGVLTGTPSSKYSVNETKPSARSGVIAARASRQSGVLTGTPSSKYSVNETKQSTRSGVFIGTQSSKCSVDAATQSTPKASKENTELEENNDVKNQDCDFLFLCSLYKDFKQVREENKYAVKISIMNTIEIGKRENINPVAPPLSMYNNNFGNFPPGLQFPNFKY